MQRVTILESQRLMVQGMRELPRKALILRPHIQVQSGGYRQLEVMKRVMVKEVARVLMQV